MAMKSYRVTYWAGGHRHEEIVTTSSLSEAIRIIKLRTPGATNVSASEVR